MLGNVREDGSLLSFNNCIKETQGNLPPRSLLASGAPRCRYLCAVRTAGTSIPANKTLSTAEGFRVVA